MPKLTYPQTETSPAEYEYSVDELADEVEFEEVKDAIMKQYDQGELMEMMLDEHRLEYAIGNRDKSNEIQDYLKEWAQNPTHELLADYAFSCIRDEFDDIINEQAEVNYNEQ